MYVVQPDIAGCVPGEHSQELQAQLLKSMNDIRALHHLPAVTYSKADEPAALAAALMMAANGALDHMPPATWRCFSDLGALGARTSNLAGGVISPFISFRSNDDYLRDFLTDVNNGIADNVGHRRWMLDPFLTTFAFGRVAGRVNGNDGGDAVALKVIGTSSALPAPSMLPRFVAYPYEEYPERLFAPAALLSFGVIADPTSRFGNAGVDYSKAVIEVRQRASAALPISRIKYDTEGYGLPNNLQFSAAGIKPGVVYDVSISNVMIGGVPSNYAYYFKIGS